MRYQMNKVNKYQTSEMRHAEGNVRKFQLLYTDDMHCSHQLKICFENLIEIIDWKWDKMEICFPLCRISTYFPAIEWNQTHVLGSNLLLSSGLCNVKDMKASIKMQTKNSIHEQGSTWVFQTLFFALLQAQWYYSFVYRKKNPAAVNRERNNFATLIHNFFFVEFVSSIYFSLFFSFHFFLFVMCVRV